MTKSPVGEAGEAQPLQFTRPREEKKGAMGALLRHAFSHASADIKVC
jgi:hypothetical protein